METQVMILIFTLLAFAGLGFMMYKSIQKFEAQAKGKKTRRIR